MSTFFYFNILFKVLLSPCCTRLMYCMNLPNWAHTHTQSTVCKYASMHLHTHKIAICSSSPQYISYCNRPLNTHSNECIHHIQCDGTCVLLSPGPQQPRQPHVHLRRRKQPSEPIRKHQAIQQKGSKFLLSFTFLDPFYYVAMQLHFYKRIRDGK